MNDGRGGKDVDSVEESGLNSRPSSESVNDHDDSVNVFDASTC